MDERIDKYRDHEHPWPYNLLFLLHDMNSTIPCAPRDLFVYGDIIATLNYILDVHLNEKEAWALRLYYMEMPDSPLKEIGEVIGVTGSRVSSLIHKAVYKLSRGGSLNARMLSVGLREYYKRMLTNAYNSGYSNGYRDGACDSAHKTKPGVTATNETPIEDLLLSVRSYNCLKRANIRTVQDICEMDGEHVVKIRNLGLKSIEEIRSTLKSLGFKPKWDDEI